MEVALALAIQILLAQIGVPALQDRFEQAKLIFLAQRRHNLSILLLIRGRVWITENKSRFFATLFGERRGMKTDHEQGRGVIERYREFLPISDSTPVVSLAERDTPMVSSPG